MTTRGKPMGRKPEPTIIDHDIDLETEVIHVNGRRLTEEFAEEIADEAARTSRERSNANLIPGRKSLTAEGKHSPVVQTRVPADVHAKLVAIAEDRHMSVSKVLREAIDEYVSGALA
ncbi:ribbon-helix-helix protein, CopG family [Mycobacterium eburneum]|nr:ribbon-helix-helix protein, CopG family [Mycobacterium eburneum]